MHQVTAFYLTRWAKINAFEGICDRKAKGKRAPSYTAERATTGEVNLVA